MRLSRVGRRLALATLLAAVGASAVATAGFGQLANEPLTANRFALTIDGVEIASFHQLSGITAEVEPQEVLETNGDDIVVRKTPGRPKPPTVTLLRGLANSRQLWAWHDAVRHANGGRMNASLTAYNKDGKPVAKWGLENAWPSKLEVGTLKSGATEYMTETVTLSMDAVQRVAP